MLFTFGLIFFFSCEARLMRESKVVCQFGICFWYFLVVFLLSITINNTRVHTYQNVNNRKEGINKSFSNIY